MYYKAMEKMKERIIMTLPSKFIGACRILLGLVFMLAGSLKLTSKSFQHAWCTQLNEIEIPHCILFFWMIPVVEIMLGILLILGYLSRIAAIAVIPIMVVALKVYLTVNNPEAFIAQPDEAFLPPMMIGLATMTLIFGGGSWSIDLRIYNKEITKEIDLW